MQNRHFNANIVGPEATDRHTPNIAVRPKSPDCIGVSDCSGYRNQAAQPEHMNLTIFGANRRQIPREQSSIEGEWPAPDERFA